MKVLVTGGAGFIGSALIRHLVGNGLAEVVNVDKLTYAASPEALATVADDPRYVFEQVDVCDGAAVRDVLARHRPDAVVHLAAESHVDRSIDGPAAFVETNVAGTYLLLEASLHYVEGLTDAARERFRFHHVSTDEVFGSLGHEGAFDRDTRYDPRSPYSATKAASDHLVRAWWHTYGLPVVLSNCSNNYGPFQFPEKLIPLTIVNAVRGRPIPLYGRGENVRDWLYVEDHAAALHAILTRGRAGETYLVGGHAERRNAEVVEAVCALLDEMCPDSPHRPHAGLVNFVEDRPGHDFRYAIDASAAEAELDWRPSVSFEDGLRRTVRWYLDNEAWWRLILDTRYDGGRLGARRRS